MEIIERNIPSKIIYRDRTEKASFIVEQFGQYLLDPLIDIGCDKKRLSSYLPGGFNCLGLDISPGADIICNLDQTSIPVRDKVFNTVLCSDVLEHLEQLHAGFAELFRIARRYVIISLPNCWSDMKFLIRHSEPSSGKFYGLPLEAPEDRHRWFFNYIEASNFLIHHPGARHAAKTLTLYKYYGVRSASYYLARLILDQRKFDNLFVNTVWAVYELK